MKRDYPVSGDFTGVPASLHPYLTNLQNALRERDRTIDALEKRLKQVESAIGVTPPIATFSDTRRRSLR